MLATFQSIFPVFLLMIAGHLLSRAPIIDRALWGGLEQLGFWFLYPVLLFVSIVRADFTNLALDAVLLTLLIAIGIFIGFMIILWPMIKNRQWIAHSSYSTVFQCAVRWNGFMALAIAGELFGTQAVAIMALAMAALVIPVNFVSVFVVTLFSGKDNDWRTLAIRLSTNPMILAALGGIAVRYLPNGLYSPALTALDLIANAALGMGLLTIGSGLRPMDVFSTRPALVLPVFLKLIVFPLLVLALAVAFGIQGDVLIYLALAGSVPTAMNGYLLARQMGGDAPLYAATVTAQTIVSFFTIPLMINIAQYLAISAK